MEAVRSLLPRSSIDKKLDKSSADNEPNRGSGLALVLWTTKLECFWPANIITIVTLVRKELAWKAYYPTPTSIWAPTL